VIYLTQKQEFNNFIKVYLNQFDLQMKVCDMFIIDCIACRYSDLKVGFLDIFNYHYRNDYIQKNHLKITHHNCAKK
jgi:hypothetical protein